MTDQFFKGKRPWSKIKDQVLGSYMPPYLSKVAKLNKPILIIDAFAGPGKFEDGSAGSPLIICQAAEKRVKGKYSAISVNKNKTDHEKLCTVLPSFIAKANVLTILGSAEDLLSQIYPLLGDQTVFLYLDPFGLTGCEFSLLEPFIKREKRFSTEIVINLSVPPIHRRSSPKSSVKRVHAAATSGLSSASFS